MTSPPKYGLQTWIGGAVILMGLGFVGAQLVAPKASTANGTQQITSRPVPRIIEINTKRMDKSEPGAAEIKSNEPNRMETKGVASARVEPVKPFNETAQTATPPFSQSGQPLLSSADELKHKAPDMAQNETPPISEGNAANIPQVAEPPRPKSNSRVRYPRYDRHAVY